MCLLICLGFLMCFVTCGRAISRLLFLEVKSITCLTCAVTVSVKIVKRMTTICTYQRETKYHSTKVIQTDVIFQYFSCS